MLSGCPVANRTQHRTVRLCDIEIAQEATLRPIVEIAREALGIEAEHLVPYGHTKAKVDLTYLAALADRPPGDRVPVRAVDGPGVRDEGRRRRRGYARVVPVVDINLHFTADFAAIAAAHNLLSALIDNHIHLGNRLDLDVRSITWKRVVDLNDRALPEMVVGLGGVANGFPREDGFDIVVASELMAIFCLTESWADLKRRIGDMVVGYTRDSQSRRSRPAWRTLTGTRTACAESGGSRAWSP